VVLTRFSAWAEQILVKKDLVFKIPKEMSFREAAVLPVAYLTAYILLFEIGNIKAGQTLLFHSAGGGVGGKCSDSWGLQLPCKGFFPSRSDTTLETGS
jgi:NADPH:quinone reductase-like Zn-dependent oxidoreductase